MKLIITPSKSIEFLKNRDNNRINVLNKISRLKAKEKIKPLILNELYLKENNSSRIINKKISPLYQRINSFKNKNIENNYRYINIETENNHSIDNSFNNNYFKLNSSYEYQPNSMTIENYKNMDSREIKKENIKELLNLKKISIEENKEYPYIKINNKNNINKINLNINISKSTTNNLKKNEDILNKIFLEEYNKRLLERQKIEEMKIKYQIIEKEKEIKRNEELKQKKIEFKQQLEAERLKIEEMKKMKEKEEMEKIIEKDNKINEIIEELKLKANKEKELELKESNLDNVSQHKFRLELLNDYIKNYLEIYQSKDIIKILQLIDKIGKLIKKEIIYDKENSKDNLLLLSDAVKSDDMVINFLGILGEEFRNEGIYSLIEKKSEDPILMQGIFKVFISKYSILSKYVIKMNCTINSKYLKEPKKWLNFIDKFKNKIIEDYSIQDSKLYVINNRIDLCEFTLVILNKNITNIKRYETFYDIKIKTKTLLGYMKLSPDFFENKFNKDRKSWKRKYLKRGGEKYIPPYGWKGFALKVLNEFDNGDNTWLGKDGKEGEWAVAYHGIGKGNEFRKLLNIVLNNFKNGPGQLYANLPNIRDNNNSLVGIGVYLAPNINEAERYSDEIQLGNRKTKFKFIIMCRVNPKKIKEPGRKPHNWIVDDNYDCLRPYRILVKESKQSNK